MCFYSWRFRERDTSLFDGVDGDRDGLLRSLLLLCDERLLSSICCYGRVANGNYFYCFAPIFITMTDTVSLFFYSRQSHLAHDMLYHAVPMVLQHMGVPEMQRVMLFLLLWPRHRQVFDSIGEQDIHVLVQRGSSFGVMMRGVYLHLA